ncbi:unnamed protein product [Ilex paraguariensis]|uniref:RING-type domain-containing protein n=1 Tax=Ilex paraguariensis TaxID=185542 RepID=A0ABC8UTQ5_9AQUA
MGFVYLAIKIPKAITIAFFVNLVNHLKFMVIGALTHLGLYKPPPEEENSRDNWNNYILILDGPSPSLVPIPVHVVTEAIRKRVPVVHYGDFLERFGAKEAGGKVCTICLDWIEKRHEIRELSNCSHVFHRECLDTWVDEGQVTCPLCRSMLLSPKKILARCGGGGGDPTGASERNNNLIGEGHSSRAS